MRATTMPDRKVMMAVKTSDSVDYWPWPVWVKPLWVQIRDLLACPPQYLDISELERWWEPPGGTCEDCDATPAQQRECWRQVLEAAAGGGVGG